VISPRYVIVQTGARRGYAVPAILERSGMLERLYTDMCGSIGIGRASAWLRHVPTFGGPFQRLHGRRLPSSIIAKTRTFDVVAVQSALHSWRVKRDLQANFRLHLRQQQKLGRAMMKAGFGQATHVYSMLGEGGPFLVEAKRRGLTVVSEVYILLATEKILTEERKAFPDWESEAPDYDALRRATSAENVLLTCSDFFVCPSDAVREDLTLNWGIAPFRSAVVPYGMNAEWLQLVPRSVTGRVLFVGTAELRKGIHYLAMAAEKLKLRGYNFEFLIAGNVSNQIATRAECRYLTFLGRVPRDQISREYELADIFALPSLAEGSAESIYEAMACGMPIVTTASAGSVVRHGIDGLIVPERDPDALANAIAQIIEDREMRERMSIAARERARDYTWDRYGERLIAALNSIPNSVTYRGNIGEDCYRASQTNGVGSTRHRSSINIRQIRHEIAVKQATDGLRILVAQNGARRNYAVPAVLAQAGMLEAFYTDMCGNVGLGRWLSAGRHLPWIGLPLNRLYQRQIPAAVRQRATSFSYSTLADDAAQLFSRMPRVDRYAGLQMLKRGLGNANLVYSFLAWGRPLLEEAKSRGIPVVTDFYVRPSIAQICYEEFRAYPGWEPQSSASEYVNRVGTSYDPCPVSDFIIVSGEAVADEVTAIHGFPRDRIGVVPLGVNDSLLTVQNQPVQGRVLFTGTCCLWKGIHYFAMAADALVARGHNYEFRVAGDVSPLTRAQPICRHLKFLDRVPRVDIKREYETADVFVFPTLADSFGIVQLEAMAAGIPVVTTRTAGSVVRHGIDGFIVPERDPLALADATAQIVEDRGLRERMSIAARERARDYTWDRYGERLIAVLKQFANR
jgi:glycosyltransferase involved in cell wall biosynthesis